MEPLVTIATAVASKVVTTALEPLIRELISAQEQQNAELEQLRQEIRQLVDGPWRLSMLHLRAAVSAGQADPERRSSELTKARDALLQAYSFHPDASITRALIAADVSMVEGLVGHQEDAATWADTAHDDITTFLRQQTAEVQRALNDRPSTWRQIRTVMDGDFWTDVLGYGDVPDPPTKAEGDSLSAYIAANTARRRTFLERGPAGWRPLAEVYPTLVWEGAISWISADRNYERVDFQLANVVRHARSLLELHAAASLARTLRQVCAEFGRRDLPDDRLVVRLRRRYGAEVTYGRSDTAR